MPLEARARTVELRARRQSCNFPTFAATAESKDFALPRVRESRPQTNKGNSAAPRHRRNAVWPAVLLMGCTRLRSNALMIDKKT